MNPEGKAHIVWSNLLGPKLEPYVNELSFSCHLDSKSLRSEV